MSHISEPFDLLAADAASLIRSAGASRDEAHGSIISYSRKVFIPLTRLCRDVCAYCTFATTPKSVSRAYLTRDEVLDIARAGAATGCKEALFTIGDKPELRYALARKELDALGHASTFSLLSETAKLVLDETGLLPHINAGIMGAAELQSLRQVSASQGLMLESASERLCNPGGPHFGSPDKHPRARLEMIEAAGALDIPFTTGILIGIGETRRERIEALLAIRDSHRRHGHIQEVIIQNFRAKANTRMARAPEPTIEDMLWTVAAARLILGPTMSIQAPPNLNPDALRALIAAGINDWGGVSPVTRDHVNPEAAWPEIPALAAATAATGKILAGAADDLSLFRSRRAEMGGLCHPLPDPGVNGQRGFRENRRLGTGRANLYSAGAYRVSVAAPRHTRLPGACGERACPNIGSRGQGLRSERGRDRVALRRPRGRICCRVRSRRRGAQTRERRLPSRMWSPGTSITQTSATFIARSARSRKASAASIYADPPTSSISPKSCGARAKRGSVERPRCACRVESIRNIRGAPISTSAAP